MVHRRGPRDGQLQLTGRGVHPGQHAQSLAHPRGRARARGQRKQWLGSRSSAGRSPAAPASRVRRARLTSCWPRTFATTRAGQPVGQRPDDGLARTPSPSSSSDHRPRSLLSRPATASGQAGRRTHGSGRKTGRRPGRRAAATRRAEERHRRHRAPPVQGEEGRRDRRGPPGPPRRPRRPAGAPSANGQRPGGGQLGGRRASQGARAGAGARRAARSAAPRRAARGPPGRAAGHDPG